MPCHTRTLLRALLEELDCTRWASFQVFWADAAANAARALHNPRLARVDISDTTQKRWLSGEQVARGDARIILEHWLGFGAEQLRQPVPGQEQAAVRSVLHRRSSTAAVALNYAWSTSRLAAAETGWAAEGSWHFAGGSLFEGTSAAVQVYEAVPDSEDAAINAADHDHLRAFSRSSRRGVLLASLGAAGGQGLYVLDSAHARRHFTADSRGEPLRVPLAYRLDDLTYALVWAVHVLDDGLLADDGPLSRHEQDLRHYARIGRSAPDRSTMPELSSVGAAWLGSSLCARYIVRQVRSIPDVPAFWTRERTGEECSPWLLWSHKHTYIRVISGRFAGGGGRMGRAFCVPEAVVRSSERYERILLFLTVALMEMHGLRVWLCGDAGYAEVDGFVLGPGRAILASWVREEAIWRVGTTTSRRDISPYEEAIGHARAHSIIDGPTPAARLRALAGYLCLDWEWLTTRSRELAAAGSAGMLQPRSRMITLSELDRTLGFVGALGRARCAR